MFALSGCHLSRKNSICSLRTAVVPLGSTSLLARKVCRMPPGCCCSAVVCVVHMKPFSFCPSTSSTHPVSLLILHPREMQEFGKRSRQCHAMPSYCIRQAQRVGASGECARPEVSCYSNVDPQKQSVVHSIHIHSCVLYC